MRRFLTWASLTIVWLIAATTIHAQSPSSTSPAQLFEAFNAAWEDNRWADAAEAGEALSAHVVFGDQPISLQFSVLVRLGAAYQWSDQDDAALAAYVAAQAIQPESALPYFWRSFLHLGNDDWDRSAQDMMQVARRSVDLFNEYDLRTLGRIIRELDRADEAELSRNLRTTLVDYYVPENPFTTLDYYRSRSARDLALDGDRVGARAIIQQMRTAAPFFMLQSDITFDFLWAEPWFIAASDMQAAFENELEQTELLIAEHPEFLDGHRQRIRILMSLGRFDEAESVAASAFDRLSGGEPFTDAEEYTTWLLNDWAYALYASGRTDEGNQRLAQAANFSESGELNVSQTINYASMLNAQGRPAESLEVIARMRDRSASSYGDMWTWAVSACAHYQLGQTAEADDVLAQMSANWEDNPAAYQRTLICMSRMDEAADLLIARLSNPDHTEGALEALQRLLPIYPDESFGLSNAWLNAVDELAERPDVQAALAPVGRVQTFEIHSLYWGTF